MEIPETQDLWETKVINDFPDQVDRKIEEETWEDYYNYLAETWIIPVNQQDSSSVIEFSVGTFTQTVKDLYRQFRSSLVFTDEGFTPIMTFQYPDVVGVNYGISEKEIRRVFIVPSVEFVNPRFLYNTIKNGKFIIDSDNQWFFVDSNQTINQLSSISQSDLVKVMTKSQVPIANWSGYIPLETSEYMRYLGHLSKEELILILFDGMSSLYRVFFLDQRFEDLMSY